MAASVQIQRLAHESVFAVPFAVALALAVVLAAKRRAPWWVVWLVFQLPIAIKFVDPGWRLFSFHGFLHASTVYGIFEHGVPPPHPLAGDWPLRYPWGFHWMVATAMRVLPLAPHWYFLGLNVASLALAVWALDRTAALAADDRGARVIAVAVGLLGIGLPIGGSVAICAKALLGLELPFEDRTDALHKCMTINTNQAGNAMFAIGMLALARIAAGAGNRRATLALLAVSLLGAGFVYAPAWVGIGAAIGIPLLAMALRGTGPMRSSALLAIGVCAATALAVVPWIGLQSSGARSDSVLQPVLDLFNPPSMVRGLRMVAIMAAFAAPVVAFLARGMEMPDGGSRNAALALAAAGVVSLLAFVLLWFPNDSHYKFVAFAGMALGPALAPAFRSGLERGSAAIALLVFFCALPFAWKLAPKLAQPWPVSVEAVSDGRRILPADGDERAMVEWISAETPVDALFIDSTMTLPVFARRSLYAASPRDGIRGTWNGWGMTPRELTLGMCTMPAGEWEKRSTLADALLSPGKIGPGTAQEILDEAGRRDVYVVARADGLRLAWKNSGLASAVFENAAGTVFLLDRK